MSTILSSTQGLLVLPHLRVQNANAISSPMTHGFPSITAFTGLMWALERKLDGAGIPLRLMKVGVVCHAHQEQVNEGGVKTFCLTRNPIEKDGSTAGIVEEGRTHLELTLVFLVQQKIDQGDSAQLLAHANAQALEALAQQAMQIISTMRVAGGSVLPSKPAPGKFTRPWLELLLDDPDDQARQFRQWRRKWLPGFALVGRDDLLTKRVEELRSEQPNATLLDALLDRSRFNYRAQQEETEDKPAESVRWQDTQRGKGSGWIVPIPVGYAGISQLYDAGKVRNARDDTTPLRFVESIYSLGEWLSPHRLDHVDALLWYTETDHANQLYRCRSGYASPSLEDDIDEDFYSYD